VAGDGVTILKNVTARQRSALDLRGRYSDGTGGLSDFGWSSQMLLEPLGTELLEILPGNQVYSQVEAQITLRNITFLLEALISTPPSG
jgi:hypothetical protein